MKTLVTAAAITFVVTRLALAEGARVNPRLPRALGGVSLGVSAKEQDIDGMGSGDCRTNFITSHNFSKVDGLDQNGMEFKTMPRSNKVYSIMGAYDEATIGNLSYEDVLKVKAKKYGKPQRTSSNDKECAYECDEAGPMDSYPGHHLVSCAIWEDGKTRLILQEIGTWSDSQRFPSKRCGPNYNILSDPPCWYEVIGIAIQDTGSPRRVGAEAAAAKRDEANADAKRKAAAAERLQNLP